MELAERQDLTNVIWSNPYDGASVVIYRDPDSQKTKPEILALWTKSMMLTGLLGRAFIVKPQLGSNEEDMSVIEKAADQIKEALSKSGIDLSGFSKPLAMSRRAQDGGWPQRKWKFTPNGAVENLLMFLRLFKEYGKDLGRFGLRPGSKTRINIHGFGFIGSAVCDILLGLNKEENIIVTGISDINTAVFDPSGLKSDGLSYGKAVREYPRSMLSGEGNFVNPQELLFQEADILITASVKELINSQNYKKIKAKIIFEVADISVACGTDKLLQEEGKILIPDLLTNGSGAYAGFEEHFHTQFVEMKEEDIHRHVDYKIKNNARFLAWIFFKLWLEAYKSSQPRTMLEIVLENAKLIRETRDIYSYQPSSEVLEAAEIKAIRDVPEPIARRLAARDVAKREILLEKLDIRDLIRVLNSGKDYEQELAAYMLGGITNQDIVLEPLLRAAGEKRRLEAVRLNAIGALGEIGGDKAKECLEKIIWNDAQGAVLRRQAMLALEKIVGRDVKVYLEIGKQDLSGKSEEFNPETTEAWARKILKEWETRFIADGESHLLIAGTGWSGAGKTFVTKERIEALKRLKGEYMVRGIMPQIMYVGFDGYLLAVKDRPSKIHVLCKSGQDPMKWLGKWDFGLFFKHVEALSRGEAIEMPEFDASRGEKAV